MITDQNNRKKLIDFLIRRWKMIASFAAIERVYAASYKFAHDNNIPIPEPPHLAIPCACRQIEILKQRIIKILPEVHFIDYNYESQVPLDPDDWIELFIADHNQCISKVEDVIKKMQIT